MLSRLTSSPSSQLECISAQERLSILIKNLARIDLPGMSPERLAHWQACTNASHEAEDVRRAHTELLAPLLARLSGRNMPPIILEGVDSPWMLKSLVDAPPPKGSLGFRQRVLVMQADWNEFFDGLARLDLGDGLGDSRFVWFVGEDAPDRLVEWVDARIDDAPPAMAVQCPSLGKKASPDAPELIREIDARWTRNAQVLKAKVARRGVRDQSWWAKRFDCINDPDACGEPIRVLIPVSRYTTYLKHAAEDLAASFSARGCQCQVLMETDDSSIMSESSTLRAIDKFDPDLIVSINYTRSSLGSNIPKDIPHVCWIQDAMSHLFDAKVGKALGKLDFVVGMVSDELIERHGYPKAQTQWMPMVASRSKFWSKSITDGFDSEIAWVTHQSEHPDVFRDRMVEEMATNAPDAACKFAQVLREVESMVTTNSRALVFNRFRELVDDAFFPTGVPDGAFELRSSLLQGMVIPYAERVFRHQTALWAANIAIRRGWRFKLYGNGWERHPQLSMFAADQLEHGPALCRCYRDSVVHLHASINQVTHQRVSECLLSGGLPLCRIVRDAFGIIQAKFLDRCYRENIGSLVDDPTVAESSSSEQWRVEIKSCDELQELVNDFHRLNLYDEAAFDSGWMMWNTKEFARARELLASPSKRRNAEMIRLIKDFFFTSEAQLESLVEQAIKDRMWRQDRIESVRLNLSSELTFDGFAKGVLNLVKRRLG